MNAAEEHPGPTGRQHAEPGRPGMIRRRIGRHGAEHEGAFEAKVHTSGFLRQTLAKRYEHERRGHAQRAADDRKQHDEEWAVGHLRVAHVRSAAPETWNILKRPSS